MRRLVLEENAGTNALLLETLVGNPLPAAARGMGNEGYMQVRVVPIRAALFAIGLLAQPIKVYRTACSRKDICVSIGVIYRV